MPTTAIRTRAIGIGAIALATTLVLAGCGRGGDTTTSSSSSTSGSVTTGPGFDGTTITLGALTVSSGALAVPGTTILDGMKAYYDALNAKGGIDGKYKVELNVQDTGYNGATAVQEYAASKNNVVAYTQVFGTSIADAILSQMNSDNIVGIPSSADGTLLQNPSMVLTGGVAEIDAVTGLEWYISEHPNAVVCYAAMEGAIGVSFGNALSWTAKQLGTQVKDTVTLDPNSTDYTPQIQQLIGDRCSVVFEKGSGVVLTTAMQDSAQLGLDADWVAPVSDWTPNLKNSPLNSFIAKHFYATSNEVNYGDSAPGMAAMMAAHDKYTPKDVPVWLWVNGYVSAMAMTDFLEKAISSGDLSRAGFAKAVNSFTELNFDGIQVPQPWGPPGSRGVATQENILKYSSTSTTGLTTDVAGFKSKYASQYKVSSGS